MFGKKSAVYIWKPTDMSRLCSPECGIVGTHHIKRFTDNCAQVAAISQREIIERTGKNIIAENTCVFSKKAKDYDNLSSLYANSGLIYIYSKRYELAEAALIESLQLRQKEKNLFGLCKANHLLGILYKEKRDIAKSEQYLLNSLQLSHQTNSLSSREEILKDLSEIMSLKGDYKQAYTYHVAYKSISNSLFNKKKHQKIIKAKMQ